MTLHHYLMLVENERITARPDFQRWFAGSKIVDHAGKPMVVYHGTPTHGGFSNNRYVRAEQEHDEYPRFDTFDTSRSGITDSGWLGAGTYFTPSPDFADEFGNFIIPCYLSIKNPFVIIDDSSASAENSLRFLMSLRGLKGVPPEFIPDLSLPEPQTVDAYWARPPRRMTIVYSISEGTDGFYRLLSGEDAGDGVGVVEGKGRTPEEAIFDYRYRHDNRFNGFLLSIIGKIGAERFTEILKANGYDGVVEQRPDGRVSEIVAYYPEQIKSLHSRGFDPEDKSFMR